MATPTARERRSADPGRTNAFTDGVFAIIITLLVLDLKVPAAGPDRSLRDGLADEWSTFASFVISFLLVGMYWTWHRDVFAQVRYVDRNTAWLNLLFLLPTSMLPFAAALLGQYRDDATALHAYGGILIAATLARTALDFYLRRHPALLWSPPTRGERLIGSLTAAAPIVVYVVAMLVARVLPTLSLVLYLAMPAIYLLLVWALRSDSRTRVAAEDIS